MHWVTLQKTYKKYFQRKNTKNHFSDPQWRRNLCNRFICDWLHLWAKNKWKIKPKLRFIFTIQKKETMKIWGRWNIHNNCTYVIFRNEFRLRQALCLLNQVFSWQLYTFPWSLTQSLTSASESKDREQAILDPFSHFKTIEDWQYGKIMNSKLQFVRATVFLCYFEYSLRLFVWRKNWWQWNVRGPARVRQVSLSPCVVQGQCRCQGGSPVLSQALQ